MQVVNLIKDPRMKGPPVREFPKSETTLISKHTPRNARRLGSALEAEYTLE
tara:strand:+ start:5838 stop:5990 length:153 start_codon:yes stop_codon:yes gene_type:complete